MSEYGTSGQFAEIQRPTQQLFLTIGRRLGLDLEISKVYDLSSKLAARFHQLDSPVLAQFLRHSYVQQGIEGYLRRQFDPNFDPTKVTLPNIEDFLKVKPEKIALALRVAEGVKKIAVETMIEEQFLPALNISCFVVLEYFNNKGVDLATIDRQKLLFYLDQFSKSETLRGKKALLREVREIAVGIPLRFKGNLEEEVIREIVNRVSKRLTKWNRLTRVFNQTQGTEVEVLSYKNQSDAAEKRRVDVHRWLPRGYKTEEYRRKDWYLLPLMGIPEDLGERPFQTYEITADPTETMTTQTTILFASIVGDFIDEEKLSDIKEGWSLHASTTFPPEIWTPEAEKQYHTITRGLAGAFSSLQRIGYGGFAAGRLRRKIIHPDGTSTIIETSGEVKAKKEGIKSIKKRKLDEVIEQTNGEDETQLDEHLLVEMRSLDLTPETHYSALHAKLPIDFAFRCYWQYKLGRLINPSSLEIKAIEQYPILYGNIVKVLKKYGISDNILIGWRELADAVNKSLDQTGTDTIPSIKTELAQVIRHALGPLRTEAAVYAKAVGQTFTDQPRSWLSEPASQNPNRIYLHDQDRIKWRLPFRSPVIIRVGQKRIAASVAMSKIKQGREEPPSAGKWRLSPNLLKQLGIPEGLPLCSRKTEPQEIVFGPTIGLLTTAELSDIPGRLINGQQREARLKQLITAGQKRGALSYVFRPENVDLSKGFVKAYTLSDKGVWLAIEVPLPDVIYSYAEMTVPKRELLKKLQSKGFNIPFIAMNDLVEMLI